MLIDDVKKKLNIRFNDSDTDSKIYGMIQEGEDYLQEIAGSPLDFNNNYVHKKLLLNYCRYEWNERIEDFEKNFLGELLNLRMQGSVKNAKIEDVP